MCAVLKDTHHSVLEVPQKCEMRVGNILFSREVRLSLNQTVCRMQVQKCVCQARCPHFYKDLV